MHKLVPFTQFVQEDRDSQALSHFSVVIDTKAVPKGFFFGVDAFISFLEYIDGQFEKKIKDKRKAFDNPAGKLIDLIETQLPLRSELVNDLKESLQLKKSELIAFKEIVKSLHV